MLLGPQFSVKVHPKGQAQAQTAHAGWAHRSLHNVWVHRHLVTGLLRTTPRPALVRAPRVRAGRAACGIRGMHVSLSHASESHELWPCLAVYQVRHKGRQSEETCMTRVD